MILDPLRVELSSLLDDPATPAHKREAILKALQAVEAQLSPGPVQTDPTLRMAVEADVIGVGPLALPERYEVIGLIGRGGMGEVHRVHDRVLGRPMALKVIRASLLEDAAAVARFIEEAQATAQLQHPGIVPVHDLGRLGDGRMYFTMKEVTGRTLHSVLREVHHAASEGSWRPAASGWTFRRVVDAFQRVCEAVAYAHSRGVVHRDLKPSNILVGEFGEVIVVDWGLARVAGSVDRALVEGDLRPELAPVVTDRSREGKLLSRWGKVAGTPAYMSPEQAAGEVERMGPATDVYALGAILYELLAGHPPYMGGDNREILRRVRQGAAPPPSRTWSPDEITRSEPETDPQQGAHRPDPAQTLTPSELIPEALRSLCSWAMAREPAERPASAQVMAAEIGAWLDGAQRREAALAVVERARALEGQMSHLAQEASSLSAHAEQVLAPVQGWEAIDAKAPGWELEEGAEALDRERDVVEVRYLQMLRGALTHDPDLPEAHALLAAYYHRCHQTAEASADARLAAHHELLLRDHDRAGAYSAYLTGEGSLTLVTDPPGAEAVLFRQIERRRYLEIERVSTLGATPLMDIPLPMGSYIVELTAPGCRVVRYPVLIQRQGHWDARPPGGTSPYAIHLPPIGALAESEVYIPAGWFWSGGDPHTLNSLARRRIWIDAFVIQRYPVTNGQYLRFLNDLVAQGKGDEALRCAPRDRGEADEGGLIYGRNQDGRFVIRVDSSGVAWSQSWPAVMVDWPSARAYAKWYGGVKGDDRWRLPWELEWEKAARGVDGRAFPWGEKLDPTFACVQSSHRGGPTLPAVDGYPLDKSVYGVSGLAGSVGDWCLDPFLKDGPPIKASGRFVGEGATAERPYPLRVYRGGSWVGPPRFARTAFRYGYAPNSRYANLGFRLVRPL